MSFKPITKITSEAVLLLQDHIDTDQIIPARFLKATSREGFGKHLFSSWRYQENGDPNPEFVLNGEFNHGKFLITGENFGCGSSREHAAWSLYDYGFSVVIAKSFADIFRGNALNNGMVPVELKEDEYLQLIAHFQQHPDAVLVLDLPGETVKVLNQEELVFSFEINPFRKKCLLAGTDVIDFLIAQKDDIIQFEETRN